MPLENVGNFYRPERHGTHLCQLYDMLYCCNVRYTFRNQSYICHSVRNYQEVLQCTLSSMPPRAGYSVLLSVSLC